MSGSTFVLGLDPGFRNLGYSVMEIASWGQKVHVAGAFKTDKSDKKRKVLAADDNFRRGREISKFLNELMEQWKVSAICTEAMSFPRNAGAAVKIAIAWGVIVALAERRRLAVVQASPQEIKLALCGSKSASKEDVEAAVEKLYSVAPLLEGTARTFHEHAYDSVAAIVTCVDSDVMQAIRNLVA